MPFSQQLHFGPIPKMRHMLHTALHRALGERPGPITDQMIDDAVTQGIGEDGELDWKKMLPPEKDFRDSDVVKDIAALANAGGGIIVFGVTETDKSADGRHDAGELTESYERTIRQVSMAAITPPVFGVQAIAIPSLTGTRAVALLIPASPDGPHLVYRNDYFGAPLRAGADTIWMKERQVEAAYRSRFDGARQDEQELRQIYDDLLAAARGDVCAILVGAAKPRTRTSRHGDREALTMTLDRAQLLTRWWLAGLEKYNPLEDLEAYGHRPMLGGQYIPPANPGDYREAHAVILDDGSVGLSWRAGGHERENANRHEHHEIPVRAVEAFAAALIALVHAVAAACPAGDYVVMLGVELDDPAGAPPEFHEWRAAPPHGVHRTFSGKFRPVRLTVDPSADDREFIRAALDVATLALNQVGIKKPSVLDTMLPPRPSTWE